jgi:Zn-dependent peptidase ImmA (M78 family)
MVNYFKWLCDNFNAESPKQAISNAVEILLTKANQKELPIKLSEIAKVIGINPTPVYKEQTPSAQLINVNNEFRISLQSKFGKPININQSIYPKLRFSYAHELIHCLGYDFSCIPPKRIAPEAPKNEEEVLCNYGAGLLMLPEKLVGKYISTLEENDILFVSIQLSKKAQVSLHASLLHLINIDFLKNINKLYLLSLNSEGYRNRGQKKPRCVLSAMYLEDYKLQQFLPTYKGLEAINKTWSLLKFHERILEGAAIIDINVTNEIIRIMGKDYILNGKHRRINESGYVWSDLSIHEVR